jgi:hypothetical protein
MRRLYFAVLTYTVLGLAGGLYFRELTKSHDFTGFTQLSVVHTHFLTLGTIVLLIVLLLEKVFTLSASRWFTPFFWTYNAGLIVTAGMMILIGTRTVLGHTAENSMIDGIAGLGHILLTVALAFFLAALYRGISTAQQPEARRTGAAFSVTEGRDRLGGAER